MPVDFGRMGVQRILVRSTNWVGDALMTTPALSALGDRFPQAHITVLAKKTVAPVFARHPAVDRVLIYEKPGRHAGIKGLWRLAGELRAMRFDLAVLFQNALEAAVIARLAGVPYRAGFNRDGRGLLLRPSIPLTAEDLAVHETEYYQRMLHRAGLADPPTGPAQPVFHLSSRAVEEAERLLTENGLGEAFLVGLGPGAAYGPAKQWPPQRFARAADLVLDKRPGAAVVFGGPNEREAAGRTVAAMTHPAVDLAGRTDLATAAALIARCRVFICNDSGLMHTAAGVGAPLVAVFGSTNPVTTRPVGPQTAFVRREVDCAPCLKTHCNQASHICMEAVSPEEVAQAALGLVET